MEWQRTETAKTGSKQQCEPIRRRAGEGQSSPQRPRLPEGKEVENGGKGAGDQSLKGGLGVGSAGGRPGRGNGRLIVPAGGSLLFPLFPWQPDRI